jgi:hypothetical protein
MMAKRFELPPELIVTRAPVIVAYAASVLVGAGLGATGVLVVAQMSDYAVDQVTIRSGTAPRTKAGEPRLRNLAIALRQTMGWTNHAAACDHYRDRPDHALQLLGLAR